MKAHPPKNRNLNNEGMPQRGRPRKKPLEAPQQPPATIRVSSLTASPSNRRKQKRVIQQQKISSGQQQSHRMQAESFIMKLFDRSLDLSKYTEQTSLYPICRAWMANQPRNSSIPSYRERRSPSPMKREDNAEEVLAKLQRKAITELSKMPAAKKTDMAPIPPPLEDKSEKSAESINEELSNCLKEETETENDEESENGNEEEKEKKIKKLSTSELLDLNRAKWKKIRTRWIAHRVKYIKEKCGINQLIIEELIETKLRK